MKRLRIIILFVLILFVGMQPFRGNLPPVSFENPDDISTVLDINNGVIDLIKNTCYDCHSNETDYPWYAYVAPVSWLVIRDVKEGRDELNFSNWKTLSKSRKVRKIKDVGEEVEAENMPMKIYTVTHPEARLTNEKRKLIIEWSATTSKQIMNRN